MIYQETYDFQATSKDDAKEKMEKIVVEHYLKYWKILHIQDLRLIDRNLRRCNLSY